MLGFGTEIKNPSTWFRRIEKHKVSIEFNSPTKTSSLKTARPVFSAVDWPDKEEAFDFVVESFSELLLPVYSVELLVTPPNIPYGSQEWQIKLSKKSPIVAFAVKPV